MARSMFCQCNKWMSVGFFEELKRLFEDVADETSEFSPVCSAMEATDKYNDYETLKYYQNYL
ncbi:MAG: hypothetical protein Q4C95_11755 [Planctomycetia bacterium]|nr:hypothetical protein [Planctomycetia bacterium]